MTISLAVPPWRKETEPDLGNIKRPNSTGNMGPAVHVSPLLYAPVEEERKVWYGMVWYSRV